MAFSKISIPTLQQTPDPFARGIAKPIGMASALQKLAQSQAQTGLLKAQTAGMPDKSALQRAQAQKTLQDIQMINDIGNAQTPPLMRAYNNFLSNKSKYGEEDPRTVAAKNAYDLHQSTLTSQIDYRNAIAGTLPFRSLPTDIKEVGARSALQRGGIVGGVPGITSPQQQPQQPQQPQQQLQRPTEVQRDISSVLGFNPNTPVQSTKYTPTAVRNAVLGTGDTPQHVADLEPHHDAITDPQHPNRLIHQPPASGQINAQQQALMGQFSPAGTEQQKAAGKDTQKILSDAAAAAQSAQEELDTLRQFHAAYKNIKGYNVGPGGGLIKVGGMPLDPAAQQALKNGNQIVLKNIGILKGSNTRLNQMVFKSMKEGNLNILMSPVAELAIYKQLVASRQGDIHKSRLMDTVNHAYPGIRTEPQLLREIATKAAEDYAPVDEKGEVHPEMFDEWANYANPRAIEAIRSGKEFLPEDIKGTGKTLKQFRDIARAKNIPIGILVKRYRAFLQRQQQAGQQ